MKNLILFLLIAFAPYITNAQTNGKLSGTVLNKGTQKSLTGVTIELIPGNMKSITDSTGYFRFIQLKPGAYTLEIRGIGFVTKQLNNIAVTTGNENNLQIELDELVNQLQDVTVTSRKSSAKAATLESPLSIQRLTTEDIKSNPGGFFDISRVIQSLPGVGGGAAGGTFRNDIIIRGGAPSENVFYLDGIEVPIINHFGTQGSGGGPKGILNVLLIEDVKLSSSAFEAKYDNALSSVFQFKQKNGNKNKVQGNLRLSFTENALTFDGPLSKKTTFIASARSSIGLLFKALNFSFLPSYKDFQFKTTTRINDKTTLTFLGIGAIDDFKFIVPDSLTPENQYDVNSNPSINQNSYTIGATLKKIIPNGFWNLSISRNLLDNQVNKFQNNINPIEAERTLKIKSIEAENKIRFDVTKNLKNITLSYGVTTQIIKFNNIFYQVLSGSANPGIPAVVVSSNTNTNFIRYGGFVQVGTRILNDKLSISGGVRVDANNLSNSESNPFKQLSPRVSTSYAISDVFRFNASFGIYYRLPTYTQLNYSNNMNGLKTNPGDYIKSTHYVAGFEYLPKNTTRFTIEGFYKGYSNYPLSIFDGISLANKGTEFGAIGNEAIRQSGIGRAYGFEIFAQQKLTDKLFGVFSYTLYRSEFTGLDNKYAAASWDNRQLISMTAGYKLPRNWEIGLKFRYQGAAPYTPYDEVASRSNFLTLGTGTLDYTRINSLRLKPFNSGDLRIDKKWNRKKTTYDFFIDITNFYASVSESTDKYTFTRNAANTAFITSDGLPLQANGSNAIPIYLKDVQSSFLPNIGLIIEF
ncbi:MAG: TonB-dependent receptor [Sediminibacterium sp.]|nr:TonB-dependent receptor [Sediminibacterium sp.]